MLRMFNLIRNENMKIVRRISTLVMVIVLVVLTLGVGMIIKFLVPDVKIDGDWKATLVQENVQLKIEAGAQQNEKVKEQLLGVVKVNEYRIAHDIPPVEGKSLWSFVFDSKELIRFVSLFTIIIGASVVANEFSAGTIKLLLIRPVRRWKILLSKYFATFMWAVAMLVILFATSFLTGGILFGFKGMTEPWVSYSSGQVVESNIVLHAFSMYGLKCVDMLMMVTLAFMLSAVFRSSALAIGIGVFLLIGGSTITQFLMLLSKYSWVKYILFANTDLTQYIDGVPLMEGMSMQFSIIVLIVYFAIFNIVSWTTFLKRDVAA